LQIDIPSLNRTISVTQTQLLKLRRELAKSTTNAQSGQLREQIKIREEYIQNMSKFRIVAPAIVLEDSLTIQEGKQEARILFLGVGHTDGDVVLFLPAQKICFIGDLLFNKAIPNVQDANIREWMKTLAEVLRLDADKFIPGHGPIAGKKDVEDFLHYFEELKMMVQVSVDCGDSLEQATKEIQAPAKYGSYLFQNFFPSNVQKMFAELKAQQPAPMTLEDPAKAEPKQPLKR
jgi:glyoxylase-like metal-dependent hydrolase (beta-lactamase superfamily II)